MLFYSIELLHIHITCLHVYYCLHIPSSLAKDARLCHGRGKDHRILWTILNSRGSLGFHGFGGVRSCMPREAWRLPSPLMLQYRSCHWPGGSAWSPKCVPPMGYWFFPVPRRPTCVQCPVPLGSCSPVCPRGLLCCVCGVLGHLAPVHRCARSVCCVACAVSWATWLPFTGVRAVCGARVPFVVVSLFLPP